MANCITVEGGGEGDQRNSPRDTITRPLSYADKIAILNFGFEGV